MEIIGPPGRLRAPPTRGVKQLAGLLVVASESTRAMREPGHRAITELTPAASS